MGLFRTVRKLATPRNIERARDLAAKNADKISGTVDKATSRIDERTGGRYRDKLDKVDRAVDQALDKTRRDEPGDEDPAPEP